MNKFARQKQIFDYIKLHQIVDIDDLQNHFGVSKATVRRDLNELDLAGEIDRVRGGAKIDIEDVEPFSLPRYTLHTEEKKRIGQAAANLVKDGETIIISTGTTTEAMVPFISEKSELTVITNALNIAYRLSFFENIRTIVLGGILRHQENDLHGHITENAMNGLVASKLFRGVRGIHMRHGFTATDMTHVRTDKKMLEIAQELIIVADHSKFSQIGSLTMAPIDAASVVITDLEAPADQVEQLRNVGVEVIMV